MWKRRRRPPQPSSCHACGFVSKITIKQQCSSTLLWPFSTVLLCVSVRIQKHTVPPATNNWNEKMLQKLKIFTNLDLESDPNHILSSLLNANLHNFCKEAWNVEFLTFEKKIRLLLIETKNCDKHVLLSIFMSDVSNESTRKRMVSRNPVPLLFITLHENHSKSVRKPRVVGIITLLCVVFGMSRKSLVMWWHFTRCPGKFWIGLSNIMPKLRKVGWH